MSEAVPLPQWSDVFPERELAARALRTWKKSTHQLVIGRAEDGSVFALDNRCPHEGYPLAQGDLQGATLTCCWHNWKFDVASGACLRGGEDVRRYATRVQDGMIQVDLTPPSVGAERQRLRHSLAEALTDADAERALREALRLVRIDTPVERILGDVALHDARRAEYGATHVLALAAVTRHLLGANCSASLAAVLAPLLELASETNQRLAERRRPPALQERPVSLTLLRRAVEAQDVESADALLQAAVIAGHTPQQIEQWLFSLCSDHFLAFGHCLIYLVQSRQLIEVLPAEDVEHLQAGLLFQLGHATREDTLPYLRSYFLPVRDWVAQFETLPRTARHTAPHALPADVVQQVLDGKRNAAMSSVWEALRDGWSASQVAQALVLAAAHRLLRFDVAWDSDISVQEGWLFATHRLTFASAVRHAVRRFDSPQALHFLFQAAAFIHSGAALDVERPEDIRGADAACTPGLHEIRRAVLERDTNVAVQGVATMLAQDGLTDELATVLRTVALDVPVVRPIFRVHAIKTLLAGLEESLALGQHPHASLPLLAAVRYLASPVVERRTDSMAYAAAEWVERGRVIRKLTQ